MSIKYNGKIIAGGYTPPYATDNIYGITRISTNDEFKEGLSKTTCVTPNQISDFGENLLSKNLITNCLLEVPQRIKLELVDGVAILKAGSEVTVPNGANVFDYIKIENDLSFNYSGTGTTDVLLLYNFTSNVLGYALVSTTVSGTTAPTDSRLYYDTANNIIAYYNNGVSNNFQYAFPLAILSRSDGVITGIKQVFNGMGYIGSTIWVDKGVKGLIPNGRNVDGSLRNIEYTTTKVATYENMHAWGGSKTLNILVHINNNDNVIEGQDSTRFSTDKEIMGSITYSYSEEDNYWYYSTDSGSTWVNQTFILLGTITEISADKSVSNFNPKQPFRAVDYSDKPTIASWGFPSNKSVTLSVGASGTVYTAPANGWFNARGVITSGQYIEFTVQSNGLNVVTQNVDSTAHTILCPVSKGQGVVFGYNGTSIVLRFIYAEGEV